MRSKQLGGYETNQLVLDDSRDGVQAKLTSSHEASELSLGKITRIETNEGRKDARGEGFELRTDAQGVIRSNGLLMTTEVKTKASGYAKQMENTTERLKNAQSQHQQTADVAAKNDSFESGEGDAVVKVIKQHNEEIVGIGKADAKSGVFPELTKPHLILSSPAGIELIAESTHIASDKHLAMTSGEHVSISAGKGFFSSVLGNMKSFVQGKLDMIAHGVVRIRSLKNNLQLLAALDISVQGKKIVIKAKDEVVLVAGDSGLIFKGGSITAYSSGTFIANVSNKKISNETPQPMSVEFEELPLSMIFSKNSAQSLEVKYHDFEPVHNAKFVMDYADGSSFSGVLNAEGKADLTGAPPGIGRLKLYDDVRNFEVKAVEKNPAFKEKYGEADFEASMNKAMNTERK